ncbi:hypothetical protein Glove_186g177 [Diversispora epigaea]|uniref:Uncharacterized protein n=1 Tax=Diversispora epigaea TaxID=1348612 RepID=A0A397IRY5_9GLOM|nr:hypothetical protein Glove_186g177 [Diversispora epigaea]
METQKKKNYYKYIPNSHEISSKTKIPAHISAICYIESRTENTSKNNFVVNAVGVTNSKYQKRTYLQITAFYPLDDDKSCDLPKFEQKDVIQVEGRSIDIVNEYKYGSIGIITDTFCIKGGITDISIRKHTASFILNGITLPNVSLNLDAQIFEKGQAYTALSRCYKWDNIKIRSLNREAFDVDEFMIKEYKRLETVVSNPLPLSKSLQNNR